MSSCKRSPCTGQKYVLEADGKSAAHPRLFGRGYGGCNNARPAQRRNITKGFRPRLKNRKYRHKIPYLSYKYYDDLSG